MGYGVSAPVQGGLGTAMVVGGGALAIGAGRRVNDALSVRQLALYDVLPPVIEDSQSQLKGAVGELQQLRAVALEHGRLGLTADVAKRAAGVDPVQALITVEDSLSNVDNVLGAMSSDMAKSAGIKSNALKAGALAVLGGVIALEGMQLVGSSIFDLD